MHHGPPSHQRRRRLTQVQRLRLLPNTLVSQCSASNTLTVPLSFWLCWSVEMVTNKLYRVVNLQPLRYLLVCWRFGNCFCLLQNDFCLQLDVKQTVIDTRQFVSVVLWWIYTAYLLSLSTCCLRAFCSLHFMSVNHVSLTLLQSLGACCGLLFGGV